MLLTCLFLSAYRTTVTVNTVNETISTTMILHYKPNVLTVYNDNNNNLIMNYYHKSLSCNNFPTIPSKPYISIITALLICMYIMSCVVWSVIKAISVFCIYGLDLSQTSTGPDRLPRPAVPAYGMFPLRSRHTRGSSCRIAPSRSVPASTHSLHFHELPDLVS